MNEASEAILPAEARAALEPLFDHLDALTAKLDVVEKRILDWRKRREESRRLATAPGVGPLTATALLAAVGDGSQFRSARRFAAWLGLAPRVSASGGEERIGRISKGGDRCLRTPPIHGARDRRGDVPAGRLGSTLAQRPDRTSARERGGGRGRA